MFKDILVTLRPYQWVKNTALFAGLIFSRNVLDPGKFLIVSAAALIFCVASGAVYLVNDIFDVKHDKVHPHKRFRPLAAQRLSMGLAGAVSFIFFIWALAMAYFLNINFFYALAVYFLIEIFYVFYFKHIVIVDIFCIAAGFLLRVIAGVVVIGAPISNWLLICTIFLSLFLALGKRRDEMVLLEGQAGEHRRVLLKYNLIFIDQMIMIVTSLTIFSYVLYVYSPETITKFHTRHLEFTIVFVIYGIFRYLYLIYPKKLGGAPERLLFSDKPLFINLIFYFTAVFIILYH